MKIVFWGTPEFAQTILRGLLETGRLVVGAVTQPDRPAGRGRKLRPPPVKLAALQAGIPVLQPERPRGAEFMQALQALGPDISIVAAYGHILRPEVLELPPLGSFNVHASLLPELRGAAPINWAIIRGYRQTGVTIMRMVEKMDAGPMIRRAPCELSAEVDAGTLTGQLAELGARALLEALTLIESGRALEEPQAEEAATYAPKLNADDVRIAWSKPADELGRWLRGCDPTPGAWSEVGGLRVRLFRPQVLEEATGAPPGVVTVADPRLGLRVATGSGELGIAEVQPAGKRRMEAAEWVRGRGIAVGQQFC